MSYEGDNTVLDIPQNLSNIIQSPASYEKAILSRDEIRFNAQQVTFNNQARDVTIKLNSSGYIDPATALLYLNLKVKHSGSQVLEDGIMSAIGMATLKIGGRTVERIEDVAALRPILYHTCTEAWLKSEGQAAGFYRYIPTACANVAALSDSVGGSYDYSGDETTADPFSLCLFRRGGLTGANSIKGFDVTTCKPPSGSGYATQGVGYNSSRMGYQGSTYCHNRMNVFGCNNPAKSFMNNLGPGTNQHNGDSRTYALPLSLIFGFFRQPQYIPLRNMPLEITLQLKSYNEFMIHTPPYVEQKVGDKLIFMLGDNSDAADVDFPITGSSGTSGTITDIMADLQSSSFDEYTISNVHVACDVLQPAPALVDRIDALAAGSTGIQMVLDTYNTQESTLARATDIALHSTRSYSHLKDIYITMKPSDLKNNLFLAKSDTWYGSLVESISTTIGSKMIPSSNPCNSPAELYHSVRKSLGNGNKLSSARGVVSFNAYLGQPENTQAGAFKTSYASGLTPCLELARSSGVDKFRQSALLPTQAHSNFLIGTNCQKVLASNSLSGLNTLGSGYSITSNIKLKPYNDTNPDNDINSNVSNKSLDACWGDAKICFTQIYHSDVLLSVANGMVQILE